VDDTRNVCDKLDIIFEIINMMSQYPILIVKELIDGYRNGITPNPDVLCNARIKFGVLKKYADANGFEKFATGHYCRVVTNENDIIDILGSLIKTRISHIVSLCFPRNRYKIHYGCAYNCTFAFVCTPHNF
jgi:tRNA-specific 2-thiouridylase